MTGETIAWTGQKTAFVAPTTSASSYATTAIPTADPGTANVSINAALAGSLTTTGSSDFIIMQASVTTAASAGSSNQKVLTISYDEV